MKDLRARFPIYVRLLGLYPASYRREYEVEILQTTADMLDEAPNVVSKLTVWLWLTIDLPLNVCRQQYNYTEGVMNMRMPKYVKSNGLMAGILLLPFFAALIANGLDRVLNHHTLYSSWLWHRPAIGLWVVYLPMLALLLVAGSYLAFIFKDRRQKQSFLKRALDIYSSWPLILVGVMAFGILFLVEFHDSAQCWTHTPSHLATHMNQALQCTSANEVSPNIMVRDLGS